MKRNMKLSMSLKIIGYLNCNMSSVSYIRAQDFSSKMTPKYFEVISKTGAQKEKIGEIFTFVFTDKTKDSISEPRNASN